MNLKGVVTGGTGYIGSNLLRYLLSKGWELYVIIRPNSDITNIEDIKDALNLVEYDGDIKKLKTFFDRTNPTVVFHLASAIITNPQIEQVSILIQSNIQFGVEILEAMKDSKTRLFINTGSYWQNYNSDSYNPVDLYSATKEAFEKIINYYVDAYAYRCITLRLFDVYGENDRRPKLLNLLKEIAKSRKTLDISLGGQSLDMVHISDVLSAYLSAYELLVSNEKIINEIFGVSSNNHVMLKDMICLYERIHGVKLNVNFGGKPYRQREIMVPCSSYKVLPNWKPLISLQEGLSFFNDNTCL